MWDPKRSDIFPTRLPVLLPDAMATAIWRQGEELFRWFFFGGVDARVFWAHTYSTSTWFREHPASSRPWSKLAPISVYGDEVCTYKNTEVGSVEVLAFSSDFCSRHPPLSRYLLLTCYSEHCASSYTYNDIMEVVADRITRMSDPNHPAYNSYPWRGAGYDFMFSSVQGDLKFLHEKHLVHPFQSNLFCSWCPCRKIDNNISLTIGAMHETAEHRQERVSNAEYLRITHDDDRPFA